MGRIIEETIDEKVLKLSWLRGVEFTELEVSKLFFFLSNSSEWVPTVEFLNPEYLDRRIIEAAYTVASWTSMRLILASRWSIGVLFCFVFVLFLFSEPAVALCVFCFCFLFGVSGKNFWNLSFGNSHCVPVKSLFFHNVVSYIFIKPHHTFTVKILKAVPSGMAYEVLIIADIFLRCKKILKLNGKS